MTGRSFEFDEQGSLQSASTDVHNNLFADAYDFSPRQSRQGNDRASKGSGNDDLIIVDDTSKQPRPTQPRETQLEPTQAPDDGEYDDFIYADIFRDVAPRVHTTSSGDSVDAIARQHLGRDASEQEVRAHADEIRAHNGIGPGENPEPGQQILLPGHNEQGDVRLLTVDKTDPNFPTNPRYTEYTVSGDPVVRYEEEQEYRRRNPKPPVTSSESQATDTACYPVSWDVDQPIRDRDGRRTGDWEHWRYRARRCPTPDGRHTDTDVSDQHIPLPRPQRPPQRGR